MASKLLCTLSASIVKKQVMAVTGLMLCGFLATHLAGNMLIFCGPEAFNSYGHKIITNPLIIPAEIGLLAVFLTHLFLAARLTLENYQARPVKYFVKQKTGRGATLGSSSMGYTGLIILIFLVLHIWNFKYGAYYVAQYDAGEMRDLYRLLLEYFARPYNVIWYVFAMLALGLHLGHGVWSAFQSLGLHHPKYNRLVNCLAKIFAVTMVVGYSSLPIYLYMQGV